MSIKVRLYVCMTSGVQRYFRGRGPKVKNGAILLPPLQYLLVKFFIGFSPHNAVL